MLFLLAAFGCSSPEDAPAVSAAGSAGTGGSGSETGGAGGTGGSDETGGSGGSGTGGSNTGGTGGSGETGGTGGSGTGGSGQAGSGQAGRGQAGSPATPADPLPCFVDEGTPSDGAIDLQVLPSRTGGVAPLSVYFDTLGTTAEGTTRPFHELAYCWDFGDEDSGSFATTGLPKNQARGPAAAHVFETPGTYSVTVTARDAEGRVESRAIEVTVEDPETVYAGSATVCLSDSGDFTGCPEGATEVTGSSLSDVASYVATGTRILLRRGATFTGSLRLNVPGPGTVGAFGDEADPPPLFRPSARVFTVSEGRDPAFSDWRVMDIEVIGQPDSAESEFLYVEGTSRDLLVLRAKVSNVGHGVRSPISVVDYYRNDCCPDTDVTNYMFIQESDLRDTQGGGGHGLLGVAGHNMVLQGNVLTNTVDGEHVVRAFWVDGGIFSHNDFSEAPQPRHLLKLHAPHFNNEGIGQGEYTERMVISSNIFRSTGGHDWSVAIGPENDESDERVRDIIVERNLFLPGPEVQVALMLWGTDMTVRDNVFNRGDAGTCMAVGKRGIEPDAARITIVHNTCYSAASSPTVVGVGSGASEITAYNNLAAGPMASDNGLDGTFADEAGNLALTDPGFTGTELMSWADFELSSSSGAIDAALPEHSTAWDMTGRPRPVDGDDSGSAEPDVGAIEYSP